MASPPNTYTGRSSDVSSKTSRKKKRTKRSRGGTVEESPGTAEPDEPLRGVVVAVSTLDVKGQEHAESQSSYSAISELCRNAGATVTGQVHKKVSYVVCNPSAVQNSTQRVRKALKKSIPLVDVAWVRHCVQQRQRVDDESYRLDDSARAIFKARPSAASHEAAERVIQVTTEDLTCAPEDAWTEPVVLGCCCVCHENGDEQCPWCEDCDVNKARKRQRRT